MLFSIVTSLLFVVLASLKEVFLARHAIFCFDHNSRT